MKYKSEKNIIIVSGLIIGIIASLLTFWGNPDNMGFCIACFIRDTVGGLGLHSAAALQYIRPEIIGIVLGSFLCAVIFKEFKPKGGSAPLTRFILGFFAMIGCLMFLGCPLRMVIRIAGGDMNAILGLIGFIPGILLGIYFLSKGYSLKRTYPQPLSEGIVMPFLQIILLILLITTPGFIHFTEPGGGPGGKRAAIILSLIAGLIVGALAQRTRFCMIGGVRDLVLFKEHKLILGFVAVLIGCLVTNLILTGVTDSSYFKLGMVGQPVAHSDSLWNALGMFLVGFACTLLGGCPLRQLILSGEGNSDSAITVLGLATGAAFAHNFGLASSADGPTSAGKIAVILGIVIVGVIGILNTFGGDSKKE